LLIARLRYAFQIAKNVPETAEFVMYNGRKVEKNDFLLFSPVSFEEYYLAIWHFVVCNITNNAVGFATYNEWWKAADNDKRNRGGAKRKYAGPLATIDDCANLPVLKNAIIPAGTIKQTQIQSSERDDNEETTAPKPTAWPTVDIKEVVDYILAIITRVVGSKIDAAKRGKFIERIRDSLKGAFWGNHYDEVDYHSVIGILRAPIAQDMVTALATIALGDGNDALGINRNDKPSKELQKLQNNFVSAFARRYFEIDNSVPQSLVEDFCNTLLRVLNSSNGG
jgi:hypothetical protein